MHRKSLLSIIASLGLASVIHPIGGFAAVSTCPVGFTYGFFNGVGNTYAEALSGKEALKARTMAGSDRYSGETVNYEVFYNTTGGANASTWLQDVAEVFQQRAAELDPGGTVSSRLFYTFWDSANAGTAPGYAHSVSSASRDFDNMQKGFVLTVANMAVDALVSIARAAPTIDDYAEQKSQLDADAAAGHKFLLVAHSQGNLFVNQAYDYIQAKVGSNLVKAVHIAPASPTVRGQWVLADIDLVINGLRLKTGFSTVPDVNLTLTGPNEDGSGHTLIGTYLDPTRAGLAATQALVSAALAAISVGPCPMSLTPASTQTSAGSQVALTAGLTSPVQDPNAVVTYQFVVTGNAGGTVKNGVTGDIGPTEESTSAGTTYIASNNAVQNNTDTVTVTAFLGNLLDSTVHKQLGMASAAITFSPQSLSLWLGAWTCPSGSDSTIYTLSIFEAPYTNPIDPLTALNPAPAGTNLLAFLTNDQNKGVNYYWLYANGNVAVDSRSLTHSGYDLTLTIAGGGHLSGIGTGLGCDR